MTSASTTIPSSSTTTTGSLFSFTSPTTITTPTTTATTTTTAQASTFATGTSNSGNLLSGSSVAVAPVVVSTTTTNMGGFGSNFSSSPPRSGFSFTSSSASTSTDSPSTTTTTTTTATGTDTTKPTGFSFGFIPTTNNTGFGFSPLPSNTESSSSSGSDTSAKFGVSAWSDSPAPTTSSTSPAFSFGTPVVATEPEDRQPKFSFGDQSLTISGILPKSLYNDTSSCDSILQVGSTQLHCHKHLLALFSPVLRDLMFSTRTSHEDTPPMSDQKQTFNIVLPNNEACPGTTSYEYTFEILVKTMYGIDSKLLDSPSATSELVNLYLLANQFQVKTIVSQVESQLKHELQVCSQDLLMDILSFLVKNQKEDLLWLINNLERSDVNILNVPEWTHASKDFILPFLQSNNLTAEKEHHVLEMVLKWIEENSQHDDASQLINCVRFPQIEFQELVSNVKNLNWLSEKQYIACLEYQVCKEKKLRNLMNKVMSDMDQQQDNVECSSQVKHLDFTPRKAQKETDIDLLIMCDCTGSMAGEIRIAQNTIKNIMTELKKSCKGTIRFSLIAYKDHVDHPNTVVSHPFTTDLETAKSYVDTMVASGGGDMPEALAAALYEATNMNFSEHANKYCMIIGDAPPHGMGCASDSYPEGDPNGHDWLQLADKLSEMHVTCYTIVCDRAKDCNQLTLFMDTVAKKTNGRCILLTQADKLPDVIVKGTVEDVELEEIFTDYVMKKLGLDNVKTMSNEELTKKFKSYVDENKITVNTVHVLNCFNTGSAALVNSNKISEKERQSFGFGAMTSAPSVAPSSGFSFGSSSCEAPSLYQLNGATAKMKKKFGFE